MFENSITMNNNYTIYSNKKNSRLFYKINTNIANIDNAACKIKGSSRLIN